ncbi:MAG: DUF2812 domain-containing protein [Christensenellales bacterium]|jgi:hypothetical protein
MKYIYRNFFIDYENEEKWLNKMSEKGYFLTDCALGKYAFVKGRPGEYIYKIELDEGVMFFEDSEFVCSSMKKIYLRKKASEEPFKSKTSNKYKAVYYEKILILAFLATVLNISMGISNMILLNRTDYGFFNLFIGAVMVIIGCFVGITSVIPIYKKVKKLYKDDKAG